MAGPVTMMGSLSQDGVFTPRLGVPTAAVQQAIVARPDPSFTPSIGSGPWGAATKILAWKGVDCAGWMALDPVQKAAVAEQYYSGYGFYADAAMTRGLVGAVDAYCGSACASMLSTNAGLLPAGQAKTADTGSGLQDYTNTDPTGGKTPTDTGTGTSTGTGTGTDYGNPDVSSSVSGKDTAGGNTSTIPPAFYSAVGQALGVGGATVASIVNSNNQVEIARLQTQAQTAIAGLQAQNAQTNNAQLQAANNNQINSLQQLLPYLQPPQRGLSDGAKIAIGVVVVAAAGGIAYLATRPKGKPVRENPVVRQGPKHRKKFINAAHLRRMRHHR